MLSWGLPREKAIDLYRKSGKLSTVSKKLIEIA